MLSKNKIKYIHSLELKKNRREEQAFIAEGSKLVGDMLGHFHCKMLLGTKEWLNTMSVQAEEVIEVSADELAKVSLQKAPQEVLAVFKQPSYPMDTKVLSHSLCLALDNVQDPGNVGTIIRLADWFGIEHVFCSLGTVDVYNPKTVQATMGALARIKVYYIDLLQLIHSVKDIPIYGTFLDGDDIYKKKLSDHGLIIMGNEGNGISKEVEQLVNERLLIPNYPKGRMTSESLNVAMATGIICAEFRRRQA
ncbi:RNA methyltransferase [Phocaeicola oris]|uniref:RNA methyltransferase n=1 Tax=Phocaeicola oris TaxID=2896850 RepID=UPI00234F45C8|nr:RNA methyltransferase [Phocaeicola oris]MCE2617487.1 RNA methyltransferase [Phocaeicola oris]